MVSLWCCAWLLVGTCMAATPTPTPTPTLTVSLTVSLTATPTTTFSVTLSQTFTLTSTPSSHPTPTPTQSTTPTQTCTATRTLTPTESHIWTPTLTPTRTRTSTATPVETLSATSTPTPTPTSTIPETSTPTPTTTCSPTSTPTSTATSTATLTATSTATPSETRTPSATLTRTATATPSATGSPTPQATLSGTPSATATPSPTTSATPTPTATQTATALECDHTSSDGVTAVQSRGLPCQSTLSLGSSSSEFLTNWLSIRTVVLDGNATLQLQDGCDSTAFLCPDCLACTFQFVSSDAGSTFLIQLASSPKVTTAVGYSPTAKATASATPRTRASSDATFSMELQVVYTLSALFVLVVAFSGALGLVLVLGCSVWYAERTTSTRIRDISPDWCLHVFVAGLYLVLLGILWILLLGLVRSAATSVPGLIFWGVPIAVLGVLLLCPASARVLADPAPHLCPVCGTRVSRWRWRGTYVPAGEAAVPPVFAPRAAYKGHTRCLRCRYAPCGAPVVADRWRVGPRERPYHDYCWEAQCQGLGSASPTEIARWCEGAHKVDGRTPSDSELACVLGTFIVGGNLEGMATLLELRPALHNYSVGAAPSARHTAAAAGNREVLQQLLEREGPLDPFWDVGKAVYSLCVTGLDDEHNDVYVCQPPLTYNRKPVYVGHTCGKYLYYYHPTSQGLGDEGEDDFLEPLPDMDVNLCSGWCISRHLGSGLPAFRFDTQLLDDDDPAATGETAQPRQSVGQRMRRARTRASGAVQVMKSSWQQRARPTTGAATAYATARGPATVHGTARHDAPRRKKASAKRPRGAEQEVQTEESCLDDHGRIRIYVCAEDVGLSRVPHALSLLEAAVSSGARDTIELMIQAYKARVPQCLAWERRVGPRMWDPCRDPRAPAADEGPVCCHLSTAFLYPDAAAASGVCVTADPAAVPNWGRAMVLVCSGDLALAAPDGGTLELLALRDPEAPDRPRAVDPSLWQPPCRNWCSRGWSGQGLSRESHWFNAVLDAACAAWTASGRHQPRYLCGRGSRSESSRYLSRTESRFLSRTESRFLSRTESRFAARTESRFYEDGARVLQRFQASGKDDVGQFAESCAVFYAPDYSCDTGTLEFCMALPGKHPSLDFGDGRAVEKMCTNAVMKLCELRRQRETLGARSVLPIYVYTYELPHPLDQIYGSMNRAMREGDEDLIAFWRPLIWQLDQALGQLPPWTGIVYRGISATFLEHCVPGSQVLWPAFSSTSSDSSVSKQFVKFQESSGGKRTLFFITSRTARCIETFSRYPEEYERLFPTNTYFQVQEFLDIGGAMFREDLAADLIIMKEAEPPDPEGTAQPAAQDVPHPREVPSIIVDPDLEPDVSNIVVSLPYDLQLTAIGCLASMPYGDIDSIEYNTSGVTTIRLRHAHQWHAHAHAAVWDPVRLPADLPNPDGEIPAPSSFRGARPPGRRAEERTHAAGNGEGAVGRRASSSSPLPDPIWMDVPNPPYGLWD